jgi:hypothetical protein
MKGLKRADHLIALLTIFCQEGYQILLLLEATEITTTVASQISGFRG